MIADWATSWHCRSRAHCRTCRADAAWREALGAPGECPEGVTLDALPAVAAGETSLSTARRAICQPCGWACGLDKRSACYVACFLRTARSQCPEGHWQPEPERIAR